MKNLVCLTVVLFAASFASATIIVGDGVNSANVYFEWSDGFATEFNVSFEYHP